MQQINTLTYGQFTTQALITNEVKQFFEKNNESTDLTQGLNSDEWYQGWLLKHLDKNKDGIPDEEFGKEFQLIYANIIENPEDYQDTEYILEELSIPQEKLIFDGSITIFEDPIESKTQDKKTKFWVRWIVVRK